MVRGVSGLRWQEDMRREIEQREWLMQRFGRAFISLRHRWCLTPNRLHKICPTIDSKCERCNGEVGDLLENL